MSLPAITSRRYSGRKGGLAGERPLLTATSTMADDLLFFDAVGEQHFMNALRQRAPVCRVGAIAAVAVELTPNLPGMRRKQQDAVAKEDSLGDRVGDEQDGEPGFCPQLQQ